MRRGTAGGSGRRGSSGAFIRAAVDVVGPFYCRDAPASCSNPPAMEYAAWLWIPVTIWAALAQTLRNAAQRSLTGELGTLGATLVRFLYGLPFAVAWMLAVQAWRGEPFPLPPPRF